MDAVPNPSETPSPEETGEAKALRGFALLPKHLLTAVSSMGGKAVQKARTGHRWNKKTAKSAGLKGVAARRKKGSL